MAQYHFAAKIIQRSRGQSAIASAAYRAGELMQDERLGRTFDFRRHLGVVYTDILTPYNAPDWMRVRSQLWNAVEKAEKRKDSQLARSLDIALPHELSLDLNIELLRGFVKEQWVDEGMIADIAIHLPGRTGDIRNVHAHIALTTREITGSGFGRKQRDWNSKKELLDWRKAWADHANRILEREGFAERIDHRSLVDQGIDREPTTHIGPNAKEMHRRGVSSDRVQQNLDAKAANDDMALLENELAESEKRIAELRRQLAAERMEQIQKTVRAADAVWKEAEARWPPTTQRPLEPEPPAPAQVRPQEPEPPAKQQEIPADIPGYAAPSRPRPSAAERIQQAQKIIRAVDAAYEKAERRQAPAPEPPPEPEPPAPDRPPEPTPPEPEPPAPLSPPTPPVPSGPAPRERPPAKYADLDRQAAAERTKEEEAERQRKEEQDRERERHRKRRRGR
jgi:hypothetical protein